MRNVNPLQQSIPSILYLKNTMAHNYPSCSCQNENATLLDSDLPDINDGNANLAGPAADPNANAAPNASGILNFKQGSQWFHLGSTSKNHEILNLKKSCLNVCGCIFLRSVPNGKSAVLNDSFNLCSVVGDTQG